MTDTALPPGGRLPTQQSSSRTAPVPRCRHRTPAATSTLTDADARTPAGARAVTTVPSASPLAAVRTTARTRPKPATVRTTFVPATYVCRTESARQSGSASPPPTRTRGTTPVAAGTVPAACRAEGLSISARPAGPGARRSTTSP